MTGALDLDLCWLHKKLGKLVRATRSVDGRGVCDTCYSTAKSMAKAREEKSMPKKANVDWGAVQRDRDAGIPVCGEKGLEKKYGVSNVTIYSRTTGTTGKKIAAAKFQPVAKKPRTNGTAVAPPNSRNGSGGFSAEISALQHKRDALDEIIKRLESL